MTCTVAFRADNNAEKAGSKLSRPTTVHHPVSLQLCTSYVSSQQDTHWHSVSFTCQNAGEHAEHSIPASYECVCVCACKSQSHEPTYNCGPSYDLVLWFPLN